MPAEDASQLEGFLSDLDRQTSNQIVVVTLPTLEGATAEEATLKIAEKWKPGVKGRDNGVVVGVFPNDKQARIEVGYGLEGAIPDAIANSILQNDMIPAFRQGNWSAGIAAGVRSLATAAAGEYKIPKAQALPPPPSAVVWIPILVFGLFFFVISRFGRRRGFRSYGPGGYRHGGWGGGGFGGFGGGGGGFGGFGGGGGGFGGGGASGRW